MSATQTQTNIASTTVTAEPSQPAILVAGDSAAAPGRTIPPFKVSCRLL